MCILRLELERERSLAEWVDFAFQFHGRFRSHCGLPGLPSIAPIQKTSEITRLLEIVGRRRPKKALEIGTSAGGTFFLFARASAPDAILVSVDLPASRGGYPRWREQLYRSFAARGQRIHLVRADSHSEECRAQVEGYAGPGGFDFLFIDGDHSYEGVAKDFEQFAPLVRPGGLVAFHDIVPDYRTRYGIETPVYTGGVPIFWRGLRDRYQAMEIVESPDQDGFGIGVVTMPEEIPR